MKSVKLAIIGLTFLVLASQTIADPSEVAGVLGMNPVPENSYAAIWVPVPVGQAVTGVRWYNNDATVVFPQVLVASGAADTPVGIEGAVVVATDVQGVSSGWSQVAFSQPYACLGEGLYCLFVFPEGSEYEAPGTAGGAAIGFTTDGEGNQGWLCADAESWMKIEGATGLAIEPVLIPAAPGMVQMNIQAPVALVSHAPALHPAYPNPFNPQTVLEYSLPEAQHVELSIFDLSGRLVRRLEQGQRPAGTHSVTWQGDDAQGQRMPSGMYLARFTAGRVNQTQRLTLVK